MRPDIWSAIGRQMRCPAGRAGWLAGRVMTFVNKEPNRLAIHALDIQPSDIVLELGFGPGDAVKKMAAAARKGRVLGIDQSAEMLNLAARRNRAAVAEGKVDLRLGSFDTLPWDVGAVDKILAVNVAYFFSQDAREIAEAHRVLKPGGLMAVYVTDRSTMSHWKFSGPDTHRLYGESDLRTQFLLGGFCAADVLITKAWLAFGVQGLLALARKALASNDLPQTSASAALTGH